MPFRGTVGKGKTTGPPRCLILQMSAFWGRRGEFEGEGEAPLALAEGFPSPLNPNKTRNTRKQKSPSR